MARANSLARQLTIRTVRNGETRVVVTVDDSGPGFEPGTLVYRFIETGTYG
jgi:C4-dicarboxylate-specific signal transduction histidine kinase